MTGFPTFPNAETFRQWRMNPSQWLPVAIDIARAHGLPHAAPHVFPTGTNLVVALDDKLILKIFPPLLRRQFLSERAALSQLRGRLEIPIPEIVLEGERDNWPYLAITRLEGVVGSEAWPLLREDEKESVLRQIGETIAAVQRAPIGKLADVEPQWAPFVAAQIAGCRARHIRLGLPRKYWDGLDEILSEAADLVPLDAPPVILTGEYIPENFLLGRRADGWRLSGLIDFGDVMTGWGEYDLLGPSAFMLAGLPGRVRSFFGGFGYGPADMNGALARRLMILLLLHRASDPIRHIAIEGWQEKTACLRELERLLWPF
jgi:hygromycin-B 7''-O-kinase